jgi:signal peptidase I
VDKDTKDPGETPVEAGPVAGGGWRHSALAGAIEIVKTLVLAAAIFFVIQLFVAQPYQVEMESMERTFEPGDYVLVDKLSPRWDPYSRGEVVVFDPPKGWEAPRKAPFIKRVIGLAGDTVEVRPDGRVYVNGTALDEPYLYRDESGVAEPTEAFQAALVVPQGELFVMGDHRQASSDSREFGPIPSSAVIGRAFVRYWPLGAFGLVQTPAYPGVPAP